MPIAVNECGYGNCLLDTVVSNHCYSWNAQTTEAIMSCLDIPYIAQCSRPIIFANFANKAIRENFYREFYMHIIPIVSDYNSRDLEFGCMFVQP